MNARDMKIRTVFLLLPTGLVLAGLLSGAHWLVRPTPGWDDLSLGNGVVWLAMLCLALLVLDQAQRKRRPALRAWSLLLLVLAAAWAPVGYLASGNWQFRFSGDTSWLDLGPGPGLQSWLLFSGGVAALLSTSVLVALLISPAPGVPGPERRRATP